VNKFGNKKTVVDGITFDSKKEAKRYQELKLLERAKIIRNLMLQQVFELIPSVELNGRKTQPMRYVADFTYFDDSKDGEFIVEDVKGFRTKEYKMKRHLMKWKHNIEVLEV
jgi:hypothetical protein